MLEDDRRASTSFGMSNKASVRKRKAVIRGREDNDDGEEHVRSVSSWKEGFHGGSWKGKPTTQSRTSRKKSRLRRDFLVSNPHQRTWRM
jgi:hypothetical protein